jgi:hypothetical protein
MLLPESFLLESYIISVFFILIWQLNRATFKLHLVIPAKAGIQYYRSFCWIPALRFAAAGMT